MPGPKSKAVLQHCIPKAHWRTRDVNACGYNPAGNCIALTNLSNGQVTRFAVNANARLSQVLIRIRPGVTRYYIHGSGLLYEVTETVTSTNALFYHYDPRGLTVAFTWHESRTTGRIRYSGHSTLTYRSGTTATMFLFNGWFHRAGWARFVSCQCACGSEDPDVSELSTWRFPGLATLRVGANPRQAHLCTGICSRVDVFCAA